MIVETPDWSAPSHVKAITTTRVGGVSVHPYDSLNLGDHVKDDPNSVRENRQRVSESLVLPSEPVWLQQIHSTQVLDLDLDDNDVDAKSCNETDSRYDVESSYGVESSRVKVAADGSMTSQQRVVCAVLSADCLPLFLTNRAGDKVALLHAGWRGMADGIIEVGIAAFDDDPNDLIAWAGPCISGQHFEIGAQVRTALTGSEKAYKDSPNQGKYLANLYQLAGERLAALGVYDYGHSSACTFEDQERFFSYRRDGECGRMASLIWIEV